MQVLLYDTPGLVDTPGQGNPLERLRSAWTTAALADQLLLIVDAERQVREGPCLLAPADTLPPAARNPAWHVSVRAFIQPVKPYSAQSSIGTTHPCAFFRRVLSVLCCALQFRLLEPDLLKLVHQLAAGPPGTMGTSWKRPPTLLFLNKQDKLDANIRQTVLQQLRQQLCGLLDFQAVFEGAAMKGEAVDDLKAYLIQQVWGGGEGGVTV